MLFGFHDLPKSFTKRMAVIIVLTKFFFRLSFHNCDKKILNFQMTNRCSPLASGHGLEKRGITSFLAGFTLKDLSHALSDPNCDGTERIIIVIGAQGYIVVSFNNNEGMRLRDEGYRCYNLFPP